MSAIKRILDEATKKAMIGVLPMTSSSTILFTPPVYDQIQVADEFKPKFRIRGLTNSEGQKLDGLVRNAGQGKTEQFNNEAFDICRSVITGWENVFDLGSGEEINFIGESGTCSEESFELLPVVIKNEIFTFIMTLHGLVDTAKMGLQS